MTSYHVTQTTERDDDMLRYSKLRKINHCEPA